MEVKTDVKERILAKAAELFMRYGIRSITMDEIAAQLGISKKTIYQFFTDKDDLVSAVIEQETHKNEAECRQFQTTSKDAVHEIFLAVEDFEEILRYTNPMMLYDLEKYHPRAFQKIREYKYQFLYESFLENLRKGIENGIYRSDLNREIVAKNRIESCFLIFDPHIFPHSRYSMSEVNFELAMLYLHSVVTEKGRKLIELYTEERTKKLSHESNA
ncbi:TetR/AcrR family transcriptional regulator [Puia dinghuensis]|uniref:TetR family transcriptional regulator n=1 Tax=Puia dinghuensis TaxID=1792502 RepID=A0A8J2XVM2_9BACT|nr:TetR/AcrR family transcriptional regulator [Puia dinghuensis]GGB13267.1 TetR family transcriptional regulator [Puia dinghuensis]